MGASILKKPFKWYFFCFFWWQEWNGKVGVFRLINIIQYTWFCCCSLEIRLQRKKRTVDEYVCQDEKRKVTLGQLGFPQNEICKDTCFRIDSFFSP